MSNSKSPKNPIVNATEAGIDLPDATFVASSNPNQLEQADVTIPADTATPDTTPTSPASPVAVEVAFRGSIDASGVFSVFPDMEKITLTATEFLAGFGFESLSTVDSGLKLVLGDRYENTAIGHLGLFPGVIVAKQVIDAARRVGAKTNLGVSAELQKMIDDAEVAANIAMFRQLGIAEADIPASGAIADLPQRRIVAPKVRSYAGEQFDIEATVIESGAISGGRERLVLQSAEK